MTIFSPDTIRAITIFDDIHRPDPALCAALQQIGTATAAGELLNLGVTRPHMVGLTSWKRGKAIAGPALTLQYMPKRQDLTDSKEYGERGMFHHYYPLSAEANVEYESWRTKARGHS